MADAQPTSLELAGKTVLSRETENSVGGCHLETGKTEII